VDAWDFKLSRERYLGDAFPYAEPRFGPGVAATFSGASLTNGNNTVWFHPPERKAASDWHLAFDPNNVWCRRIEAIMRAAQERWRGLVQVNMTDLGGNLDIVSTFRPSEELLYDLYDSPDEVKRLTWEAHDLWWQSFDHLNRALHPSNPGYTAWTPIFSEDPYYMLQCDFCYMIGPDMFDEFVKPELAASCKRLKNAFYHLDGPGQLPHLDSLLTIPELKGVQWIPGAGQKPVSEWPEVYRKIHAAGKKTQIWDDLAQPRSNLEIIADQVGSADGIVDLVHGKPEHEDRAIRFLEKFGAM
jgi:5-methyltetrahydrofolate--homocysteine methyltransferase